MLSTFVSVRCWQLSIAFYAQLLQKNGSMTEASSELGDEIVASVSP